MFLASFFGQISPAILELHDGIMLWANSLNETLRLGEDPRDGLVVTRRMWDRQLDGINGTIRIDANGDRDSGFLVMDLATETGRFEVNSKRLTFSWSI